ncbi:hypothetical protein Pyn_07094 [Prunus yedoensis var. nudiflora]|uniref:Uncharacterized protein n=1 Tax=Prunus yedoensis var. nudiflora TaxID=2094558 RepID=A0A314UJX6_PRUYE|nr:hypothetical protein Pyn_07094 [Prunus yedoensis var. nudiflora]
MKGAKVSMYAKLLEASAHDGGTNFKQRHSKDQGFLARRLPRRGAPFEPACILISSFH